MKNITIEKLLAAKKLHVDIAKKNLALAHNEVNRITNKISSLKNKLAQMERESAEKRQREMKKFLAKKFTKIKYSLICNIYDLTEYELSQQKISVWHAEQAKKKAIEQVEIAKEKLNYAIKKHEKILHIAEKLTYEQMVREELISEEIENI